MSLPDSIEFDLELENGKIALNLIKQSRESIEQPLIITESEGQSAIWKQSEELLGDYKDYLFDATATVTIKKVDDFKEIFYMITFTHDDNSVYLGPSTVILDDFFAGNTKEDGIEEERNNKTKVLNVGGALHVLFETPTIRSRQDINLVEDYTSNLIKEQKIVKRSGPEQAMKKLATVRIFTVIDHTVFQKFFGLSKAETDEEKREDARKTIQYIFTHMMERVKKIYERIEINDLKITTKWVGAFIAESAAESPFTERSMRNSREINGDIILENIRNWLSSEKEEADETKWPHYDYLAAFTSLNMKLQNPDQSHKAIYGITRRGHICSEHGVGMVTYETFNQAVIVLSHELGHSLGMDHDGDGNSCKSSDIFIMEDGYKYETNDVQHTSYFFSKCSVTDLIEQTNNLGFAWRENLDCLQMGEDFNIGRERDIFLSLYPGQIFDTDEQCRITGNPRSRHISGETNAHNICQKIVCTSGRTLKAMDGTTCADGAWCLSGKCVPDKRAPRAPGRCIYGDYKVLEYIGIPSTDDCKNEVKRNPNLCSKVKTKCCVSCSSNWTSNGDCKDVLDECSSLEPRDCYYDYYAATCCKTCRALVQNPSDANCLYGDKGTGCSDIVPEVCHLSKRYCCQTCAAYFSSSNTTHNISESQTTRSISSTTRLPITTSITTASSPSVSTSSSSASSCTKKDYKGTLEYIDLWGKKLLLNCKQLVNLNSSFCYDDAVQDYCCASCSSAKMIDTKDYCKSDNDKVPLKNLSKNITCKKLVKYYRRLCDDEETKRQCCKSCGFTIRPLR